MKGEIQGFIEKVSTSWTSYMVVNQMFYNGLNQIIRKIIDAVVGGILNTKTLKVTYELFEEMAMNSY